MLVCGKITMNNGDVFTHIMTFEHEKTKKDIIKRLMSCDMISIGINDNITYINPKNISSIQLQGGKDE